MAEESLGGFGAPQNRRGNRAAVGEQLTKERIREVDEKYPSPREKAEEVWAVIQLAADELDWDYTRYDILCFAIQFIGMMSLGELATDEKLRVLAKNLNIWLNHHHYHYAEEIFDE